MYDSWHNLCYEIGPINPAISSCWQNVVFLSLFSEFRIWHDWGYKKKRIYTHRSRTELWQQMDKCMGPIVVNESALKNALSIFTQVTQPMRYMFTPGENKTQRFNDLKYCIISSFICFFFFLSKRIFLRHAICDSHKNVALQKQSHH